MKNFEIFFDIIDNHTCVHMHVKKNFKIFHFSAKFLNFLKGPPVEFFRNRFFSTSMHSETKFYIDSGWVLTFGLEPLPRELWKLGMFIVQNDILLALSYWDSLHTTLHFQSFSSIIASGKGTFFPFVSRVSHRIFIAENMAIILGF